MGRRHRKKPGKVIEEAKEKVKKLFALAEDASSQRFADRYVHLARKIAMKHRLPLPRGAKRKFCKHCYTFFRQGKNCRVRVHQGKVVYSCLTCKKFMRFPYTKK